jgi:hypothetical protein
MIEEAKTSKRDLKFWWEYVGENQGLWTSGLADPIVDMWAEVEEALENISNNATSATNHYDWRSNLAEEILTLGGCARIGLSQFCT